MNETSTTQVLPKTTSLGPVTLAVSNLSRSIEFYNRIIGLSQLTTPVDGQVTMGAGHTPLLHLIEIPNAKRQPSFSTGLYHVAILLPTRADLVQLRGR